MRYLLLGGSGLRVSEACLGTMTFGNGWGWGASPAVSEQMLDLFVEQGGNFIDTANLYSVGESETILGEAIATRGWREKLVLGTKFSMSPLQNAPNSVGNHRKSMVQSLEASLKRLKTDHVDLLWVHAWDATIRPQELMRGLDDLVRSGKVLHVGMSNAPAWVIAQCNTLADLRGWSSFVGLQVEYNLVERAAERELLPMARALDLGVLAWSPLASGVLTGKYSRPDADGSRRLDKSNIRALDDRSTAIAHAVGDVAAKLGRPPAHVALAWLAKRGVIPVLGATTLEQLTDNLGYRDLVLGSDDEALLETASKLELGYPHEFLQRLMPGMRGAVDA